MFNIVYMNNSMYELFFDFMLKIAVEYYFAPYKLISSISKY